MGLLDDLDAAANPPRKPCKLCVWLDTQPDDIRERIESPDIGATPVEKALKKNGVVISHHTITRHREVCCGTR